MNESSQRVCPKRRYCLPIVRKDGRELTDKRWPRAYGRSQQAFQLANLASCAPRSNLPLDPTCGRLRAHKQLRVSHPGVDNTIEAILMGAVAGAQVLLFALG